MHLFSLKKYTKIIALVFLAVLVLSGVIFFGKNTSQNLFSRASSCGVDKISSTQVSANSAVVTWESTDVNQGSILYGISANNLSFTAPEGTSGKIHNVPLTLLTPNTVYYYLVAIGDNRCDSTGQKCDTSACIPWSFTTTAVSPQQQIVAPLATPTVASVSATITLGPSLSPIASPSSYLSAFCQQVKLNVGASKTETIGWETAKQFDVDGNGIINGMDVIKCPKTGK